MAEDYVHPLQAFRRPQSRAVLASITRNKNMSFEGAMAPFNL